MISSLARRDASSRASNAADIAAKSRARSSSASLWSKLGDDACSRGVDDDALSSAIPRSRSTSTSRSRSRSRSYRRTPGVPHSLDLSLCRPGVCPPHARHGFPPHPSEIPSGVRGSSSGEEYARFECFTRGLRRSYRSGSRVGCGYTSRTSSNAFSRSRPPSTLGSSSRHTTRRDPPGVRAAVAAVWFSFGSPRTDRLVDAGSWWVWAETAAMGCARARARTSRR